MNFSRFIFFTCLEIIFLMHLTKMVSCRCFEKDGVIYEENDEEYALSDFSIEWNCEVVEDEKNNLEICETNVCHDTASSILENMDDTVDPCDDFYKFSCGNFLKDPNIPKGNAFMKLTDEYNKQIDDIIMADIEPNEIRALTLPKILYQSCMNEKSIEEQGLNPLKKILKDLGGWPVLEGDEWKSEDFSWKNIIQKHRQIGQIFFYFMDFGIRRGDGNTGGIIELVWTSLSIVKNDPFMIQDDKFMEAYYKYMTDMAVILGADRKRAAKELKESLEFEIKLAKIIMAGGQVRKEKVPNSLMSVRQLKEINSNVSWLESINDILAPITSITEDEKILDIDPGLIPKLVELLEQTPKRVLANYILWKTVENSALDLNKNLWDKYFEFQANLGSNIVRPERQQGCLKQANFPFFFSSISSLYARKYFDKKDKSAAADLVTEIKREIEKTLKTVEWMDEVTRKAAQNKLEHMGTEVAYPDYILDDRKLEEQYRNLELSPESYYQNMINAYRFYNENSLKDLRRPVDEIVWEDFPRSSLPFYAPHQKTIVLPVGGLQGTFFGREKPKYMNYGAIGWIVGREIIHGLEVSFDKDVELVNSWQPSTKAKYFEKAQCVVDQYKNFTKSKVDVTFGKSKIIADIAGIKMAYQAYQKINVTEARLPKLENYSPQQMFWISAANDWCRKIPPMELKPNLTITVKSPERLRVIGSMSNMPEFIKDFNCPVGSNMNPEKKCSVW